MAWYTENNDEETHGVGLKRPNAWRLYDMLGNVYEWCHDVWRDDYTEAGDSAESGADHVIRGGRWSNAARVVRAAYRGAYEPAVHVSVLGFRCLSSQ